MQAKILDGKKSAQEILAKVLQNAPKQSSAKRPAGLAVIQVGNNPASSSYIKGKQSAAEKHGLYFEHLKVPSDVKIKDLEKIIDKLAHHSKIDGFILQLPLDLASGSELNHPEVVHRLLDLIPPNKDADGLHTTNQGKLYANESSASHWTSPLPATALGIIRLLEHNGYAVSGKNVCIIGKSRLVGMPTAGLCLNEGATVTVCHSKTPDISKHTREADIIVVATGKKHLLSKNCVRDNQSQIVIDVGIHSDPVTHKLTGDVCPSVYPLLKAYSPVPGGVGPMTVAMLIENTIRLSWQGA